MLLIWLCSCAHAAWKQDGRNINILPWHIRKLFFRPIFSCVFLDSVLYQFSVYVFLLRVFSSFGFLGWFLVNNATFLVLVSPPLQVPFLDGIVVTRRRMDFYVFFHGRMEDGFLKLKHLRFDFKIVKVRGREPKGCTH